MKYEAANLQELLIKLIRRRRWHHFWKKKARIVILKSFINLIYSLAVSHIYITYADHSHSPSSSTFPPFPFPSSLQVFLSHSYLHFILQLTMFIQIMCRYGISHHCQFMIAMAQRMVPRSSSHYHLALTYLLPSLLQYFLNLRPKEFLNDLFRKDPSTVTYSQLLP